MQQITVSELKARLDAGEDIDIVDVREGWELMQSRLENIIHIPMDQIPDNAEQIAKDKPVVILCHTGRRSAQVTQWLAMQGYDNVINLAGGIAAWSREIDPDVPQY
jgi:rhodanese-related sulfurtransferase